MSYSQHISTDNPALVIIAIDQSGSMAEAFTNVSMIVSKSEIASMIASAMIDEMKLRSTHIDGLYHYFDFVVLGYSRQDVYPLINNTLQPAPITTLENITPTRQQRTIEYITPDNHLFLAVESFSEWITPQAAGATPMIEMLDTVTDIVDRWCNNRQNRDSFPPIILNITDGLSIAEYNSHHLQKCNHIKEIGTNDGKALLFNIYIDSMPASERHNFTNIDTLSPQDRLYPLAEMSSPLPELFHPLAHKYNPTAATEYRAFCHNAVSLQIIPSLKFKSALLK